ncbi:MAG TPA: hypothetical protein VEG27_01645 [Usitatibacter sp.]|nr:hypothetical protein [Usitatibacter sp.]
MEAVECELQYSRPAAALVALAALATAVLAGSLPLPLAWRIAAVAWVVLHAARALAALRAPRRLGLGRDGSIRVEDRLGRCRRGAVRPGCFVAPWLVIVRWRPEGCRLDRTLLIGPGAAGPEVLRRIRVVLRWA